MPVELSIVICTRNRGSRLSGMLNSLETLRSRRSWEALLVDNGSTDDTMRILTLACKDNSHIRTLRVARIGLGAARDAGWREAKGEIVAFSDDDCYLDPYFVDCLLEVFDERPEISCVGGPIMLFDKADYPVTIDERHTVSDLAPYSFVRPGALAGANFSFRRNALEKIGGIDPEFGAGTPFPCEDIDAVAAVAWAGMKSTFDPRPVVFHHHGRKLADLPSLLATYDRGRGAYFAKYILQRDSRVVYLQGWVRERFTDVHRGSLTTLGRELASAHNYLMCRGKFGALALSMPIAFGFFVALALKIALCKVVPAQRSRASVAQHNRD